MRSELRPLLRDILLILAAFAVAGLVAAFLWYWWWSPAPTGVAVQDKAYFDQDDEFRGTATYMLVGGAFAFVLGGLLTWRLERHEVVTLGAVVLGACLGGALMAVLGAWLGPESAAEVARRTANFEEVAADLRVEPWSPYLTWPAAATTAAFLVLCLLPGREPHRPANEG